MIYPKSEIAIRDLVRTFTSVLALLSNDIRRIDIEYTGDAKSFLILYRAGGNLDKNLSYDTPSMVFQCYGNTRMGAFKLANALCSDLADVHNSAISGASVAGFESPSISWVPDRQHARYIVQATARVYSGQ